MEPHGFVPIFQIFRYNSKLSRQVTGSRGVGYGPGGTSRREWGWEGALGGPASVGVGSVFGELLNSSVHQDQVERSLMIAILPHRYQDARAVEKPDFNFIVTPAAVPHVKASFYAAIKWCTPARHGCYNMEKTSGAR